MLALALAGDARACTCAPVDLERDLPLADAVFVGAPIARRGTGSSVILTFRVEQVYKGALDEQVEVETSRDGSTCGLELELEERVGLLLDRDGDVWRASLCSRVDPAELLELTDIEDNTLPRLNWGGYVVGVLVLGLGGFLLARRLRRGG